MPLPMYFFATLTTRRRLASARCRWARVPSSFVFSTKLLNTSSWVSIRSRRSGFWVSISSSWDVGEQSRTSKTSLGRSRLSRDRTRRSNFTSSGSLFSVSPMKLSISSGSSPSRASLISGAEMISGRVRLPSSPTYRLTASMRGSESPSRFIM